MQGRCEFGLIRLGIEPDSTVSIADALSMQPLNGKIWLKKKNPEMQIQLIA